MPRGRTERASSRRKCAGSLARTYVRADWPEAGKTQDPTPTTCCRAMPQILAVPGPERKAEQHPNTTALLGHCLVSCMSQLLAAWTP